MKNMKWKRINKHRHFMYLEEWKNELSLLKQFHKLVCIRIFCLFSSFSDNEMKMIEIMFLPLKMCQLFIKFCG